MYWLRAWVPKSGEQSSNPGQVTWPFQPQQKVGGGRTHSLPWVLRKSTRTQSEPHTSASCNSSPTVSHHTII